MAEPAGRFGEEAAGRVCLNQWFGNRIEKPMVIELSPGRKAQRTAKWARIMTKVCITRYGTATVPWKFVEFGGLNGDESAGI